MAKRKARYYPLAVRLPVAQRAAVIRLAAQRGVAISALIREALQPYVDSVNGDVNNLLSDAAIPVRSIVAPANRAPIESPANRSGFSEKLK